MPWLLREVVGGRQAVAAGADDDDVVGALRVGAASTWVGPWGDLCTSACPAASGGARVASADGRPTSSRRPLEEESPSPPRARRGGGGAGRGGRRVRRALRPVHRDPGRPVRRATAAARGRGRPAPTRRDAYLPAGPARGRGPDPGRAELPLVRRAAPGVPFDLRGPARDARTVAPRRGFPGTSSVPRSTSRRRVWTIPGSCRRSRTTAGASRYPAAIRVTSRSTAAH